MSLHIAVTGASGHIGNVLCRKLLEKGYRVKAFYNSDAQALQELDLDKIQGSVLSQADLTRLIRGCDYVVNCAAIISIDGDEKGLVFKTNTEGPKNVLAVALQEGVKKVIHLSSVHAVTELPHTQGYDETRPYKGKNDFVYDFSKATGEQILLNGAVGQNMEVVVVRPSCVIGPCDFKPSKMGTALLDFYKRKIPLLPQGGYDMVDVRDVADSICQAIEKGKHGEIYLLSGKFYNFNNLAEIIENVTQIKTPRWVLPTWFLLATLPFIRIYSKITGTAPIFTRESLMALKNGHPRMDNSKAKKALGHTVRPLDETLRDFYRWAAENNKI